MKKKKEFIPEIELPQYCLVDAVQLKWSNFGDVCWVVQDRWDFVDGVRLADDVHYGTRKIELIIPRPYAYTDLVVKKNEYIVLFGTYYMAFEKEYFEKNFLLVDGFYMYKRITEPDYTRDNIHFRKEDYNKDDSLQRPVDRSVKPTK